MLTGQKGSVKNSQNKKIKKAKKSTTIPQITEGMYSQFITLQSCSWW